MVDSAFRVRHNLVVNNAVSINSTAIYLNASNTATINSTFYTGTSNNTLHFGGFLSSAYQTIAGLAANVINLTSNNSNNLGGFPPATYQTTAGLAANVQTLSANNANNLGGLPASFYASNSFVNANFAPINSPSFIGSVRIGNTAAGGSLICNGNITSTNNISDSLGLVRSIPVQAKTAAYTLLASDNGQTISITTGGITVDGALVTPGFAVTIFNNSGVNQTITPAAGTTIYLAGTSLTGARTLLQRGLATVLCVATNQFAVTGAGIS